jgi:nitrogen fixation NifU-like protein
MSDATKLHFDLPQNQGALDAADPAVGTGVVGAADCGDVMKLQLKVVDGVIQDAKFKTFGCGSAIAASSLATEWIKGKTLAEAAELESATIMQELSLPPVKVHCSVLAEDAVKAALRDYKVKHGLVGKE